MLKFNQYEAAAKEYALPDIKEDIYYLALGLCGEAGEVADKMKRIRRGGEKITRKDIIRELGDVLWYLTMLTNAFHSDMDAVAAENLNKLKDRKERNKIVGSGDDR